MKLYERIENNNFDEIDRNRAIELIEGGNGHLVYNENYFKLQKENEELKSKNKTLEELLQENLYELYKYYKELAGAYQGNCIPVQTIKAKIEELDIEISACEYADDDSEEYKQEVEKDKAELLMAKKVLQQLLDESEE